MILLWLWICFAHSPVTIHSASAPSLEHGLLRIPCSALRVCSRRPPVVIPPLRNDFTPRELVVPPTVIHFLGVVSHSGRVDLRFWRRNGHPLPIRWGEGRVRGFVAGRSGTRTREVTRFAGFAFSGCGARCWRSDHKLSRTTCGSLFSCEFQIRFTRIPWLCRNASRLASRSCFVGWP